MRKQSRALLPVGCWALFTLLIVGCAPTEQYARFAQAGTVYTAAIDRLLVVAGNTAIDKTSEVLLQEDEMSPLSEVDYVKFTDRNRTTLKHISQLRTHARLLARYFDLLNQLATSDAPTRAQQAVGGVIKRLNSLGTQLRGSPWVTDPDVFTRVTEVAVGFYIRGVLKDELERRKKSIQIELNTQEVLLEALADDIVDNIDTILSRQEGRLVIKPLIASNEIEEKKQDEWIAHRRRILTTRATVDELKTASKAAKKLREAFEDLIRGDLSFERINALLTDLQSLLAIGEAIKS